MNDATRKAIAALVLTIHQASGAVLRILQDDEGQQDAGPVQAGGEKFPVPTFGARPPQDEPE